MLLRMRRATQTASDFPLTALLHPLCFLYSRTPLPLLHLADSHEESHLGALDGVRLPLDGSTSPHLCHPDARLSCALFA